jgi:hypothetical protein
MQPGTATIQRIDEIVPLLGSDRGLVRVRIGDFYSVVEGGRYSEGDLVVFIASHCVLPDILVETLGATGKLSGKAGHTVKTRELNGCLSHGILYPVDNDRDQPFIVIPTEDGVGCYFPVDEGLDVTEALGIEPSSHLISPRN